MAEKVLMIALSPTMEEGTILKWAKKEGDKVKTGDVLCEVETDKASMEYESSQEGTLLKIVLGEGKQARVGDMIAVIGKAGEDFAALLASSPATTPVAAAVSAGPVAVSATGMAISPGSGSIATASTPSSSNGASRSSPLARKIAADKGIDISALIGSGPSGRIIKRDVEAFTPGSAPAKSAVSAAVFVAPSGEDIKIPVTGKRAAIAKKVAESMASAPHFYTTASAVMDPLVAARNMLNKEVDPKSKVSFNAFIIKLCAEALKRHPGINASWQGDHILQFGSIDIALAVDLGNGLMMPIVRNVGNKGVVQIDKELKLLIEKVGNNTLKPEEYTGATFSISNLGSFGVEEFTAILNAPGAAILALGESKKTPVVNEDDSISVATLMRMTLSADHRAIDGSMAGKFIYELKRMIENPVRVIF